MALHLTKHDSQWKSPSLSTIEEAMLDEEIHQAVIEGLYKSSLETNGIQVTVTNGQVYLRGTIESFDDFIKVEEFITHIKGVQGIHNELQVRS